MDASPINWHPTLTYPKLSVVDRTRHLGLAKRTNTLGRKIEISVKPGVRTVTRSR
tara:strand:- start:67 stop:231 length:165 start_codon:yes stop_codon:yes gene_type:complete